MVNAIRYTSTDGRVLDLTRAGDWRVSIMHAGIEGLVGKIEAKTLTAPGLPGQIVESWEIPAVSGKLTIGIAATTMLEAERKYREVRSIFAGISGGVLEIQSEMAGRLSIHVRLEDAIAPPQSDISDEVAFSEIEIPLVADHGVWWTSAFREEGKGAGKKISIYNSGDCLIRPTLRWNGDGGAVKLPSGYTFRLPQVANQRTLLLDELQSCMVLYADGSLDQWIWNQIGRVVAEPIAPGKQADFELPLGSSLEWEIGVCDPWRL